MNILAIRSPSIINNFSTAISPALPIGLAYIVGAIKDLAEIEVIDPIAYRPNISEVTPYKNGTSILGLTPIKTIGLIKNKPDICLISSMFSMEWPLARDLINLVKQRYPECLIIAGGEHFSALPKYSLLNSSLDIVVMGEGEVVIREIIKTVKANGLSNYKEIEGTVVKCSKSGEIIIYNKQERIRNIDTINIPAWEYFEIDRFLDKGIGNSANSKKHVRPIPLNATRGCPYKCTFCSNPDMWGVLWRSRSPDKVISEMKYLIEKYNITHFDFTDLTLAVKKTWLIEFSKLLINEKLTITWGLPSGTRSEALDEETQTFLYRAGLRDIDYAPESGSNTILKIMQKRIDKNKMVKAISISHKLGILTKANIILGYPEEKRRHVLETYYFIVKMAFYGLDDILITSLSIYPGSEVYKQISKRDNIVLDEDYFLSLSSQGSLNISNCHSNYYTAIELWLFKMISFCLFYISSFLFRPKRLLIFFHDLVKMEGSTRLSMGTINIINRVKNKYGLLKNN